MQKGKTVIILVPDDWFDVRGQNYYMHDLISSCESKLVEAGYQLDVVHLKGSSAPGDYAFVEQYIEHENPIAVILARILDRDPVIGLLKHRAIPFSVFGHNEQTAKDAWVDIDNTGAIWLAARKCIDLGHQRIALLNGPACFSYSQQRLLGYRRALAQAGLTVDPNIILYGEPTSAMGSVMASYLIGLTERPTALVCATDELAIGAMDACVDLGFSPGRDISITGYGNSSVASEVIPRLATIDFSLFRAGQLLADAVIAQLSVKKVFNGTSGRILSVNWVAGPSLQIVDTTQNRQISENERSAHSDFKIIDYNSAALNRAQQIVKVGSWSFDPLNGLLNGSKNFFNVLGMSHSTELGLQELYGLMPADDVELFQRSWDHTQYGRPFDVETRIIVADIEYVVRWRGEFVYSAQCLLHAEGILQDVSDEVNVRKGLVTARSEAEKANRSKDHLLSNISHEIRTPIHAILGLTQMLKRKVSSPDELGLIEKLTSSGGNLLSIINNMLFISKVNSSRFELESYRFDMQKLVHDLQANVDGLIGDRPVALVWPMIAQEYRYLIGDPVRLHQVLLNLLANAVKFTPSGEIELGVEPVFISNDGLKVRLVFFVRDTGIGIPPDQLQIVFDPFAQTDASISRVYGGTGLGLSIVKRLVGLMGSKVELESDVGVGSNFRFEVGFDTSPAIDSDPFATDKLRVLIVDDSASERLQAAEAVLEMGWSATVVESGSQALDEVSNTSTVYDLILIDDKMPGMSGLEVAQQLHTLGYSRDILIYLMISSPASELPESWLQLADGLLSKPLNKTNLLDTITETSNGSVSRQFMSEKKSALKFDFEGLKVLCVDDSPINLELLLDMLVHLDIESVGANNADQALEILKGRRDIDLILTDLQMPYVDGFMLTNLIHQLPEYRHIPVIGVSAGIDAKVQSKMRDAGIKGGLSKPFSSEQLVSAIQTVMNLGKLGDAFKQNSQSKDEAGEIPLLFNIAKAEMIWSSKSNYKKQLKRFEVQYSNTDKIDELLSKDSFGALSQYVHTLAGVAGVMGFEQLAVISREVESCLIDYTDSDSNSEVKELLNRLVTTQINTLDAISGYCEDEKEESADANLSKVSLKEFTKALDSFDPVAIDHCLNTGVEDLPPAKLHEVQKAINDFDFERAISIIAG